jgi:hypothetical protein
MLGIESPDPADEPVSLLEGWSEVIDPEGGIAMVPDPAIRKKQAVVVSILAALAGFGTLFLIKHALLNPNLLAPTVMAVAASLGLLASAVWLARGRTEWRVDTGRLVLRRRFGRRVRDLFEGVALELDQSTDSDGDHWFELVAIAAGAPASPAPGARDKGRRKVTSVIHDPHVPRRIGLWMSARAGVPMRDRTTPEERAADYAAIRQKLEESGRLGQMVGGWIDRMGARHGRPS